MVIDMKGKTHISLALIERFYWFVFSVLELSFRHIACPAHDKILQLPLD